MTVTVQSRDQKELVLLRVDPATGETMDLVTERDKAWVNLETAVLYWLADGKRFVWISERDGGRRLELRGDSRRLGWDLVPPEAGFQALVHVDVKDGRVTYHASANPEQSHLFRSVFADNELPVALTTTAGVHGAKFSKDHSLYVHTAALAVLRERASTRPRWRAPGGRVVRLRYPLYGALPRRSRQGQDAAFHEASLLTYAGGLTRPLLIVHRTADDNVYFRHSLHLADALFRSGKEFEILPLSGLTHMVPDPDITERLWPRIAKFFQVHLGRPISGED